MFQIVTSQMVAEIVTEEMAAKRRHS